ncbi:unnamed protein product [Closterium sp. NIES-54]
MLVVDDYTWYTTVFPLRSKGEVVDVLIPWIHTVRLQLRERFGQDLPVMCLHSDRGVMEVARTSMMHAAAPHFLWPFAVQYIAHQLNLWPHVSFSKTSPTLRWTGEVGDASVFRGPAPSGMSKVDPLPGTTPVQVAVVSGADRGTASGGEEAGGAESEGAETGGAELGGVATEGGEPGGTEREGVERGGATSEGAESGGAEPQGAALSRASRAGGAGAAGAGGTGVAAGACVTRGTVTSGPGGARTRGNGAARTGGVEVTGAGDLMESVASGAGGAGAGGVGVGGTGAGGTGPASPLPAPSPYTEQSGGLTERHEPESRPVSPVRTSRRTPRSPPPPVPGTHAMTLRPSSVPLRVPLPAPPESSLPKVPDLESDHARAASPTVSRLLAAALIDPSFESAFASALVAELLDFDAACRLDYGNALVAESASAIPPSVEGECALSTDVLEDREEDFECLAAAVPRSSSILLAPEGDLDAPDIPTLRSYAEAITGPYSSQWQAAMDTEMASWKSTNTYVNEVPPPGANIVDGMWILRVKRLPGSPPAFKRVMLLKASAPREWHNTLRTTLAALGFALASVDPSLFLCTDTSLPPLYVLVYVDNLVFTTADTKALTLVKSELEKRHTCTDLGELHSYLGLQITRDRARRTITLTQSHMVHQVLQCFSFQFSSPQPNPLSTSHSLSGPPLDESVEPSDASWVDDSAMQRSSQGYTFSLGSGSVSWRSTRSSLVLSSSCEAEIYARAMAAQELHWLTYLLTHLGEQPCSPPVLYVDSKATIALCQEHRLEHRTKHIALQFFLARELQQRGQLRLAYVASRANTADIFTKALPPGDHQRFSTVLGIVPILLHLLNA